MEKLDLFEIIIRQHSEMLRTFIRSIAFDRELVDDVFQDTVVAAWRQIDSFDRTRPVGPWLRGIARNCIMSAARYRKRSLIDDEIVLARIEQQMTHIDGLEGDTFAERTATLQHCMQRLAPEQQEALDLCYIRSLPATIAASLAHVSHDAMRKRLQRARSDLLECLRRHEVLGANR
jgi:RNA polymerase sigma-70 factor (ECF subfamily)